MSNTLLITLCLCALLSTTSFAFFKDDDLSQVNKHHGPAYTKDNHALFLYHSVVRYFKMTMDAAFLQKVAKESQDQAAQKKLVKVLRQLEVQQKVLLADGLDAGIVIDQDRVGSSAEIRKALETIQTLEVSLRKDGILAHRVDKTEEIRSAALNLGAEDPVLRYWLNARLLLQQRWVETVAKHFQ